MRVPFQALVMAITLSALLGVASLSVQAAPVATIAAADAPGTYAVSATGFGDGEVVSVWASGPSQQVLDLGYQEANNDGTVSFNQLMPRHLAGGRWAMTLHGLDDDQEAIVTFDLPSRGPNLTVQVGPQSGPVGSTFTFTVTGFQESEGVSYWLTGPNGASYEGGIVSATDANGGATFSYTIGAESQPGVWQVSAYGLDSDNLAVGSFTVTAS